MFVLGYCLIIILAFGYSLNIVGFFGLGFKPWFYGSVFLGLVPFLLIWIGWVGSQVSDLIFSPRIGLEVGHP